MIEQVITQAPIVGSVCGLLKTSYKVYNASLPGEAVCLAAQGILLDCTPPYIKYPLLCAYLVASDAVTVVSGGNPVAIAGTVNATRLIVEKGLLFIIKIYINSIN